MKVQVPRRPLHLGGDLEDWCPIVSYGVTECANVLQFGKELRFFVKGMARSLAENLVVEAEYSEFVNVNRGELGQCGREVVDHSRDVDLESRAEVEDGSRDVPDLIMIFRVKDKVP